MEKTWLTCKSNFLVPLARDNIKQEISEGHRSTGGKVSKRQPSVQNGKVETYDPYTRSHPLPPPTFKHKRTHKVMCQHFGEECLG